MGVLVALSGRATIVEAGDAAVVPKLEDVERSTSNPPSAEADRPQALPATVTICQDSSAQRCWTEGGATDCASDANPDAKIFRQTGSTADPGKALEDCWAAVRR
jgi:hypothetical protein